MGKLFTNILLVEDDEDDKFLFFEALEAIQPSIVCHWARDGEQALALLSSNGKPLPECIFMDFNMPKMNGGECLRRIKGDERLKHIPVIIISTSDDVATLKAVRTDGATAFITKPPTHKQLVAILAFYLVQDNIDKLG